MSGYKKLQKSFRSCSKKIEKRASLFQAFRQGYIYNFLYRKKETNQQFRKGGRAFTRHFTDHGLFIHLLKVCMLWMSIPEGWCGLSSRTLKNIQNISNAKRSTYLDMYSMVPNNSAARLLIFEIFSLTTSFIWTYTLIKIQIIFLPKCLLSIISNFVLSNFNNFYSLFSLQLLQ